MRLLLSKQVKSYSLILTHLCLHCLFLEHVGVFPSGYWQTLSQSCWDNFCVITPPSYELKELTDWYTVPPEMWGLGSQHTSSLEHTTASSPCPQISKTVLHIINTLIIILNASPTPFFPRNFGEEQGCLCHLNTNTHTK